MAISALTNTLMLICIVAAKRLVGIGNNHHACKPALASKLPPTETAASAEPVGGSLLATAIGLSLHVRLNDRARPILLKK